MLHLLEAMGYPDVHNLHDNLENGFDSLTCWGSYAADQAGSHGATTNISRPNPWSSSSKRTLTTSDAAHHPDDRKNTPTRVIGPARSPDYWPVRTVALHDIHDMDTLRDALPGRVFAAASFAILQEDEHGNVKIRRGASTKWPGSCGRPRP